MFSDADCQKSIFRLYTPKKKKKKKKKNIIYIATFETRSTDFCKPMGYNPK